MANYDNPNGFECISPHYTVGKYTASATIAKGDLLAIASGQVLPFAPATHEQAIGVALESASSGETLQVIDDPDAEFRGQVSGTYAATMDGTLVGVEGTTGTMEVDENAVDAKVLRILRHAPVPGSQDIGANSRVEFKIASHALSGQAASEGFTQFLRGRGSANSETLSDAKTLLATDPVFQRLDPGGSARVITLPAEEAGLAFYIYNAADAAENLTVNNDAAGAQAVLNQNEAAWFVCDGTSWVSFGVTAVVDISA